MSLSKLLLVLLPWLLAAAAVSAAEPARRCDDPAHRQFDFWLGEWTVHKPDGVAAGTNRIEREYGDCVVHERYSTPSGYKGESLNVYDAGRQVWHQTWVDNSGLLLLLEGRLVDKSMVLEGETRGAEGTATKHRITWTPNPDGTLRQLWESTNAKGDWVVAFDGLYRKKQ
jgi:hypothetical protein